MRDDLDHAVHQWRVHRLWASLRISGGNDDEEVPNDQEQIGLAVNEESAEAAGPNPDGFAHHCIRLPRGHAVALAHDELVLLDRTLAHFDEHDDETFLASEQAKSIGQQCDAPIATPTACPEGSQLQQSHGVAEKATRPRRRRGAFHLDPKVLEARVAKRYELFQLPESVNTLFGNPRHEKDWSRLTALANIVVDSANGVFTVKVASQHEVDELRETLSHQEQRSGLAVERPIVMGNVALQPGDRMVTPVASLSPSTTDVRFQKAARKAFPLSEFGEKLRANAARKQPASLRTLWQALQERMQDDAADATHNGCFLQLCLDLGQLLWQDQCHRWTGLGKAWISEQRVLSCVRWYMQGQRVGDNPVFNGMCAICGHLLYGPVNTHTATTSNKFTGAPRNIKGLPCNIDAQPPFLL